MVAKVKEMNPQENLEHLKLAHLVVELQLVFGVESHIFPCVAAW